MNSKFLLCLALVLGGDCHAAIIFPAAPKAGRQIAYEKVSRVLQAFPQSFRGLTTNDLTITNALAMYDFSAQDVISNNLLSATKLTGWLYPFMHGTNAVCYVPLATNPNDGTLSKRGGVFGGQDVRNMLVALQKANGLPEVEKQEYECRYLMIFLSFRAIWFHGKTDDVIIPMPPVYYGMKANQPYSEKEIIMLLKPEAENILNMARKYPHLPD